MPTKTCRICGFEKDLTKFYQHRKTADGVNSYCKKCTIKRVLSNRSERLEKASRPKRCPRCQTVKPRSEFHKNKRTLDGLVCYCMPCMRAYQVAAQRKNKEIKQRREAAREAAKLKAAPNPKSKRSEG